MFKKRMKLYSFLDFLYKRCVRPFIVGIVSFDSTPFSICSHRSRGVCTCGNKGFENFALFPISNLQNFDRPYLQNRARYRLLLGLV